jgi:lysophospholipase L1-like esterase
MFKTMLTTAGCLLLAGSLAAQVAVKSGDRIAFLGDSITSQGNSNQAGYVNLVMLGLKVNGINAVKIPAGISGHKSNQMLARLKRDVLDKKPQIMTLSCGVNDVGHGKRGVELPDFKKNITAIVEQAQAAGIRVCILTATMNREDPKHPHNIKLAGYNEFLRGLAREKNCLLADLNGDMQKIVADFRKSSPKYKGNVLTVDGLHMNPCGNVMMAKGVLRALGLDDAQIAKAEAAWDNQKSGIGTVQLSVKDFRLLRSQAAAAGLTIQDYISRLVNREAGRMAK